MYQGLIDSYGVLDEYIQVAEVKIREEVVVDVPGMPLS